VTGRQTESDVSSGGKGRGPFVRKEAHFARWKKRHGHTDEGNAELLKCRTTEMQNY